MWTLSRSKQWFKHFSNFVYRLLSFYLFDVSSVENCECQSYKKWWSMCLFFFFLLQLFRKFYRITTFHYIMSDTSSRNSVFIHILQSKDTRIFFSLLLFVLDSMKISVRHVVEFRVTVICFWIKMADIYLLPSIHVMSIRTSYNIVHVFQTHTIVFYMRVYCMCLSFFHDVSGLIFVVKTIGNECDFSFKFLVIGGRRKKNKLNTVLNMRILTQNVE